MDNKVLVTLEFTPNPNTLKFVVNQPLAPQGAANFPEASKAAHSPLARKIFEVPGVQAVLLGSNFVTITKSPAGNWDILAEQVPQTIQKHLQSGGLVFEAGWSFEKSGEPASEIEKKIRRVLDEEIRPAVAMDGGDITFAKYEDGIVYLHLQGACSACPSSIATLKMGVESRLKDIIPEIKEVVQI